MNSATSIIIEQVNPPNKRLTKTYSIESGTQEGPINPVKCLFMIQRKKGSRNTTRTKKVNNITKESNIFTNKTARDTTSSILINN